MPSDYTRDQGDEGDQGSHRPGPGEGEGSPDGRLIRPAFWAAYLMRMWALDDPEGRCLARWFGVDAVDAEAAWDAHLWGESEVLVPFGGGHRVVVTSVELPTDWGTEFRIHHPGWGGRSVRLADVDRYVARRLGTPEHQRGPGLSWREAAHLARTPDRAAPGVHDPHARLLLLLPVVGDAETPKGAVGSIGAALTAAGVAAADAPAAARFLLDRPVWPAARWESPASADRGRRGPSWRGPSWCRRVAGGPADHVLRCDAPASPRHAAHHGASGVSGETADRLARALGTRPDGAGR
ncbi:hypothetical protein ACFYUY_35175 [Kitasatospora sp. NPDC004745]|uniref:hypothetical protein n=1 Tax=Kitasatospora sp. NPDC004745 TaxID=3364019 RepID=UPI00368E22B9